jgi:RNA polymerase sigma factor (sigma-70 family)
VTIEAALPLVTRLAREVRRMFAPHIDIRDLQQAGAVGLMKAAKDYDPALGKFEAFAYFRIKGAIIDSQKRRVYREERNVSLDAIEANGWVPRPLGIDDAPLADELVARDQARRRLRRAIEALPAMERYVLVSHLRGATTAQTATILGRGVAWTRQRLAAARMAAARAVQ